MPWGSVTAASGRGACRKWSGDLQLFVPETRLLLRIDTVAIRAVGQPPTAALAKGCTAASTGPGSISALAANPRQRGCLFSGRRRQVGASAPAVVRNGAVSEHLAPWTRFRADGIGFSPFAGGVYGSQHLPGCSRALPLRTVGRLYIFDGFRSHENSE